MGKFIDQLNGELKNFILAQKIFFVASAPSDGGFVNVSPKGYDTFRILNDRTVGYFDYPGSGNETAKHIQENRRLTFMFCGFEEKPLIVRLYGSGRVVQRKSDEFYQMEKDFGRRFGPWGRQIILLDIEKIKLSCGESVPYLRFHQDREDLHQWAKRLEGSGELDEYIEKHS